MGHKVKTTQTERDSIRIAGKWATPSETARLLDDADLCARLAARVEELERDAMRYRWLRQRSPFRSDPPVISIVRQNYVQGYHRGETALYMIELDAEIDAALNTAVPTDPAV